LKNDSAAHFAANLRTLRLDSRHDHLFAPGLAIEHQRVAMMALSILSIGMAKA
jgi:hypothetical protein